MLLESHGSTFCVFLKEIDLKKKRKCVSFSSPLLSCFAWPPPRPRALALVAEVTPVAALEVGVALVVGVAVGPRQALRLRRSK